MAREKHERVEIVPTLSALLGPGRIVQSTSTSALLLPPPPEYPAKSQVVARPSELRAGTRGGTFSGLDQGNLAPEDFGLLEQRHAPRRTA